MDIIQAREIIRSLAEGVDPSTGEVLCGESVYNKPDVIRALYTVLEVTAPKSVQPLDPYRNAGKPWTELEDDKLREEFDGKKDCGHCKRAWQNLWCHRKQTGSSWTEKEALLAVQKKIIKPGGLLMEAAQHKHHTIFETCLSILSFSNFLHQFLYNIPS